MELKKFPRLREEMHCETLDNGLSIFVVEKPEFQKCFGFFATKYGGMDMKFSEDGTTWQDSPAGVAHFLEHKLFDTEDGNALQDLASNGASPNAFTSNDMTGYYFESSERFIENLKILLSFVSVPWFTPESVDKEQGIIGQEIGMIEDEPGWKVYNNLLRCLFQHHPIRTSIAGTVESIAEITDKTLYACHKAFYHPANMVLTVVGNVKAEEVVKLAQDILPKEKRDIPKRDYGQAEQVESFQKEEKISMEVATPLFQLGFKGDPRLYGLDGMRQNVIATYAMDVLVGSSSPLYNTMYAEGMFTSLGCGFDSFEGGTFLYIGGESKDPKKLQEAVLKEATRLATEGIDQALWDRIKKGMYGSFVRSLNSFEGICINQAEDFFRGCNMMDYPDVFDTVTKADAEKLLKEWGTPERSALSTVLPKGA